jgi:hypothetical protein
MKRFWAISLLLLSLAAGAAAGLFYAWQVDPVTYADAGPASLRDRDKVTYLAVVGDLYWADGDLALAQARLAELGIAADGAALASFVEAHLNAGGEPERVRNLAYLAMALGGQGGILQVFSPTATTVPVPHATSASAPTLSPPTARFRLTEQTALCAPAGREGRVSVWVVDANEQPLSGVELTIMGPYGGSSFFTGLKPEEGMGYADLWMASDETYDVGPAVQGSDMATGLSRRVPPGLCPTTTLGLEWRLAFQRQ